MKKSRIFLILVLVAVAIKAALFVFMVTCDPAMKIAPDSNGYLNMANVVYTKGVFAQVGLDGELRPEIFRTPGYPLFLGFLHELCKIPLDGVVLFQVFLTCLTAWMVYLIAIKLGVGLAALSAGIVLLDLPTTVWSLRLVTESVFTLLLVLAIWMFISYLQRAEIKFIIGAALFLVLATYVRPISYFLAIPVAGFIIYANAPKRIGRSLGHAVIFLVLVFGLLGLWSWRNHQVFRTTAFSSVSSNNYANSILGGYVRQRFPQKPGEPDVVYYVKIAGRSLATMMLNPGTLKHFHRPVLSAAGKVFAYVFMIFWMVGLIFGVLRIGRNVYFQFLAMIMAYFIAVTVFNVALLGNERFRVVIMPCIAIISAYGWIQLRNLYYQCQRGSTYLKEE